MDVVVFWYVIPSDRPRLGSDSQPVVCSTILIKQGTLMGHWLQTDEMKIVCDSKIGANWQTRLDQLNSRKREVSVCVDHNFHVW